MLRVLLLAVVTTCFFQDAAMADLIFGNMITGTNPNTADPYTAGQVVIANVTATGIGRGSGITGRNSNNRYNASSWSTALAIDLNDYFTFGFSPDSGFAITLAEFAFVGEASSEGPKSFAFRSSIDGFSSDIGTVDSTGASISLATPQFESLSSAVEFRLYGWNAVSGGGTFSVNDFSFNGSVTAVPEPSSMALVALMGGGATVWGWRKRRREAKVTEH